MQQEAQTRSANLKQLSNQDFLSFGVQNIAYVRPTDVNGKTKYAIHSADGKVLSVMDNAFKAYETIRNNNLDIVNLQ